MVDAWVTIVVGPEHLVHTSRVVAPVNVEDRVICDHCLVEIASRPEGNLLQGVQQPAIVFAWTVALSKSLDEPAVPCSNALNQIGHCRVEIDPVLIVRIAQSQIYPFAIGIQTLIKHPSIVDYGMGVAVSADRMRACHPVDLAFLQFKESPQIL